MQIMIKAVQGKIELENIPNTNNVNVHVQREGQFPQSIDVDIQELQQAIQCLIKK